MRILYRFLLALAMLGSCATAAALADATHYPTGGQWFQSEEDPNYWGYYKNGVQVAGYDADFDEYRLYDRSADQWGAPMAPPWGYRTAPSPKKTGNFGNNYKAPEQVPAPKYRINGKPSSREQVISTIRASATAAPKLPQDGNKLRVTAIGAPADRQPVDRDMATAAALQKAKEKVVYKSYNPSDWEAVDLKPTGRPTISIIDPQTRQELHRQNEYDGPENLALAIEQAEAQRTPDPNFNPANSPDLRNGLDPFSNPAFSSAITAVLLFGAAHLALRSKL